jgi:hypothetical protein
MFKCCTEDDGVKEYSKKIISKRKQKCLDVIKKEENKLNGNSDRDIDTKLKKWRLKERKHEFEEKINSLTIKELLPKTVI